MIRVIDTHTKTVHQCKDGVDVKVALYHVLYGRAMGLA